MVICKGKKATVVKYTQSAAKSSINNIIAQWRFSGGYIYDQDLYDQFRLGLYGASWNGCGWIAAYNAMMILGNPRPPAEIIQHFDGAWGNIALGTFGVNPFVMIDFFSIIWLWWQICGVGSKI